MREIRQSGSEGGEAESIGLSYPYQVLRGARTQTELPFFTFLRTAGLRDAAADGTRPRHYTGITIFRSCEKPGGSGRKLPTPSPTSRALQH